MYSRREVPHDFVSEAEMIKLESLTLSPLVFLSSKERSVSYNNICTLFRKTGFIFVNFLKPKTLTNGYFKKIGKFQKLAIYNNKLYQ